MGRPFTFENSLAQRFPGLAAEFDVQANAPLTASGVSGISSVVVWWRCQARGHRWQAPPKRRVHLGVPIPCQLCRLEAGSIAVLFPEAAREFDVVRNGGVTPDQVHAGAAAEYYWTCSSGHTFAQSPRSRLNRKTMSSARCQECCLVERSIATLFPRVVSEFSAKNDSTPDRVLVNSCTLVTWECAGGHEFVLSPNARLNVQKGTVKPCQECRLRSGSIAAIAPGLVVEFDVERNGKQATEVYGRTPVPCWWVCKHNPGHRWMASPGDRTRNKRTGCPHCSLSGASRMEVRVAFEFRTVHPFNPDDRKVDRTKRMKGEKFQWDCDLVLRDLGLIVEYDGALWHSSSEAHKRDARKTADLEAGGWTVVRIRAGAGMPRINALDLHVSERDTAPVVVAALVAHLHEHDLLPADASYEHGAGTDAASLHLDTILTVTSRRRAYLNNAELKQSYESGSTAAEIASSLGVSKNTVVNALHAAGVKMRPSSTRSLVLDMEALKGQYADGMSLKEVGALNGVSLGTVRRRLAAEGVTIRAQGSGQ